MSDFDELRTYRGLAYTLRPISTWPGERRCGNRQSQFRATLSQTMRLLRDELGHLAAKQVVLEMAFAEADLRLDGWPRAHASAAHPGVVLSFESKHGPLRYATCEFTTWQENMRAIALGLNALRAVDRYGITRRGEQYAGWKQLTAGGPSASRGRQLIAQHGSGRAAQMATHPDHGGSPDDFADVMAALEDGGS